MFSKCLVNEREEGSTHVVASSKDLVPQPGEIVNSQLVFPSIDANKNIVTLKHFNLRELAS